MLDLLASRLLLLDLLASRLLLLDLLASRLLLLDLLASRLLLLDLLASRLELRRDVLQRHSFRHLVDFHLHNLQTEAHGVALHRRQRRCIQTTILALLLQLHSSELRNPDEATVLKLELTLHDVLVMAHKHLHRVPLFLQPPLRTEPMHVLLSKRRHVEHAPWVRGKRLDLLGSIVRLLLHHDPLATTIHTKAESRQKLLQVRFFVARHHVIAHSLQILLHLDDCRSQRPLHHALPVHHHQRMPLR